MFASFTLVNMFGSMEAFSSGGGTDWNDYGLAEILFLVGFWIGWIWTFCLQCAGGVLCYLGQRNSHDAQKAKAPESGPMASVDARALRQSRMQKK